MNPIYRTGHIGMDTADRESERVRRMRNKLEHVQWLRKYDWAFWGTFNLRPKIYRKAAVRRFEEWVRQIAQREDAEVYWVRVGERGPEQNLYHYHVLVSEFSKTTINEAKQLWWGLAGELHFDQYDRNRPALDYMLKSLDDTDDPDIVWHLPDEPPVRTRFGVRRRV